MFNNCYSKIFFNTLLNRFWDIKLGWDMTKYGLQLSKHSSKYWYYLGYFPAPNPKKFTLKKLLYISQKKKKIFPYISKCNFPGSSSKNFLYFSWKNFLHFGMELSNPEPKQNKKTNSEKISYIFLKKFFIYISGQMLTKRKNKNIFHTLGWILTKRKIKKFLIFQDDCRFSTK